MIPLNRSDRPPPPGPEYRIVRLKALESVHCILLCRQVWGVFTHWDNRQRCSQPCFVPTATCKGHRDKLPLRWKGFLHALTAKGREIFLEITPTAAEELLTFTGQVDSLRGMPLVIQRMAGDKARLKLQTWGIADPKNRILPDEQNPYKTLLTLWGYHDLAIAEVSPASLPSGKAI